MSSNLSRGLQTTIDNTDIVDGKIRFAVDTGRLFMDTASERIEFTDVVKGLKYSEIIALENPLPKVYLSSDSHQILLYDYEDEDWYIFSGGLAPSLCVVDIYFNDDGNTVLVYGDGSEKVIQGGSEQKEVDELKAKVTALEETVAKFASAIEILQDKSSTS